MRADPFTPLTFEEEAGASAPAKPKAEKKPIVPVPEDAPECTFRIPGLGGAPVKMWAYRDEHGYLLGFDARFEHSEGGVLQKQVLPVTFCDVGDKQYWTSKSFPVPRPLYGLDRLAARPDAPVIVAEGCKSADAAGALLPDYVAVTWPGGSNATAHTSWAALRDRTVLIWPDRDRHHELNGPEKPYDEQAGTITANNIADKLKGLAAEVRLLDLEDFDCKDGWDAADALTEGWTPEQASAFVLERTRVLDFAAASVTMPHRFEYRQDGLYYVESETKSTHCCGRLRVLAKTRDIEGAGWGLLLDWRDDDGRRHLWSMPKSMLSGDGGPIREALLERGLFVSTESKGRGRLLHFLATVDTNVRARAVTKVGWEGHSFVLPHTTIGDTPTERVIFQMPEAPAHQYLSRGTLSDWQDRVAKLCPGNSRLVFAVAAAFTGPILGLALEEGGGINYVGGSSSGKTTCLAAATSVWGPPKYMRTWRATSAGLEGVAAQHSETFLALDELGQLNPNDAGEVAYMLANGQGRQRSSRTGLSKAVTGWTVLYLSTGEIGLADLVKLSQKRNAAAGQEVRILDVPADAGKGMGAFEQLNGDAATADAFSRLIKTAAAENYGIAAEAFIAALAADREAVGGLVAAVVRNFVARHSPKDADGQVLRAARRFGLVAAAGELAIKFGILPWERSSVMAAAATMFKAWVDRRGGAGGAEERNIIAQVRSFFEKHGSTRFDPAKVDASNLDQRGALNRAGFYDYEEGARIYWVLPEAFKEIAEGFDHAAVVAALKKIGALRPANDGRSAQTKRPSSMGTMKVYVIGPEIFAAPEPEPDGEQK